MVVPFWYGSGKPVSSPDTHQNCQSTQPMVPVEGLPQQYNPCHSGYDSGKVGKDRGLGGGELGQRVVNEKEGCHRGKATQVEHSGPHLGQGEKVLANAYRMDKEGDEVKGDGARHHHC